MSYFCFYYFVFTLKNSVYSWRCACICEHTHLDRKTPVLSNDLYQGEDRILGAGAHHHCMHPHITYNKCRFRHGEENPLSGFLALSIQLFIHEMFYYVWHILLLINSRNIFEVVIKFSITFTLCGFVAYPLLMNFTLTNNVVTAIMPHFYCSIVCQVFHNHGEESKRYLGNLSGMYFFCR